MHYAKINKADIANGPGVRVSLWVSGCKHRCKGCFNPETWNFNYGQEFTDETIDEILKALEPEYIAGLSILGGEPLDPDNYWEVAFLVHKVKAKYPNKTIWIYTGYEYHNVYHLAIMDEIDVLVDGRFIEELKDISLKFRGSRNQRLIDLSKTFDNDYPVLWEE